MNSVVITGAARTAIGSFNGALADFSAPRLGAVAIKAAIERSGLTPEQIDEVIMGNVLTAGIGQAPARQASIFAGLPERVPTLTIGKVCGSGLKSVMLAAQAIACNDAEIVVAGGQESMTNAPYLLDKARSGYKLGNATIIDSMIKDGLWDVYNDFHMGSAAELCAVSCNVPREAQDEFSVTSYKRALEAIAKGYFKNEIVGVPVKSKTGETMFDTDEEPGKVKFEKISSLKPVFKKDGTVTAANASSLNDGAAALVVMSEDRAKKLGVKPLARIVAQASAAKAPAEFTTAPVDAVNRVLQKAKFSVKDIDLFEINEAFAVVSLACNKLLDLDPQRVNVHGGAVALGHPIGASGARILVTLVHAMIERNARRGLASICIGGGEASALIIERM